MKRWCYRCGSPNSIENETCSECGFSFDSGSERAPRAPIVEEVVDDEDQSCTEASHHRLMRAGLLAGTIGVWVGTAVVAITFLFFVSVAVVAFVR